MIIRKAQNENFCDATNERCGESSRARRDREERHLLMEMASVGTTQHFNYEVRTSEYPTEEPHVHVCPKNSKENIAKVFLDGNEPPAAIDELHIEYDKQIDMKYRKWKLKHPFFGNDELKEILSWANEIMELGVTNWAYAKATYPRLEGNACKI